MIDTLSTVLFVLAGIGVVLVVSQLAALALHVRRREMPLHPSASLTGVSVLKPLCGIDDDLVANLETFANQRHPVYELLLGVRSEKDPAFAVAADFAVRYPDKVKVVVQQGAPGKNPKVNQLITLSAAAQHDVLVVSDSNVRVDPDYLGEIAHHLADPEVGLVTHPIVGRGAQRLGSLLDNLHMTGDIAPCIALAKRLRKDIVVGKSMSLRRSDIAGLGGFAAVKDFLAEDYVMGVYVSRTLGKRVVLARRPVYNISRDRSLGDFVARYKRWSVIHRKAMHAHAYLGQGLLNPVAPALAGLAAAPSMPALAVFGLVCAVKVSVDGACARVLRARNFGLRALFAVPLKDIILSLAWLRGFFVSTVDWRGNRLHVLRGTRLADENGAPAE